MLQSTNVRTLWDVKKGLIKDINYYIRNSVYSEVNNKTKLLSLIYSAWSEAQFLQILYTPNGFMDSEILEIKAHKDNQSIAVGWKYMLSKAMTKVGNTSINQDIRNRLNALVELVNEYIEEPCILRNKIAHGQWINALNRDNTAKNEELTNQLNSLDPVEIEKRFEVHRYLGYIIRDLVQSPKVGFHRHYWTNIVNLENYIKRTKAWCLESKRNRLLSKPITYCIKNG